MAVYFISLFSIRGRLPRGAFATRILGLTAALFLLSWAEGLWDARAALVWLNLPFLAAFACAGIQRCHDRDQSGWRVAWLLLPVFGPLWLGTGWFLRKGTPGENVYGPAPFPAPDYLTVRVPAGRSVEGLPLVNDVTGLNPIPVLSVKTPSTIGELRGLVRGFEGPLCVGGGHFSMGGQTASPRSLHLDLRRLNRVLSFSPEAKTIRVQTGARWCDLQRFLDPHGLSVKIMQTYANFTVGGALSVNAHGRYLGLGPVILSVKSVSVLLADGSMVQASPTENAELFYGLLGGYNGLGILVEAELELAANTRLERLSRKMRLDQYTNYFKTQIRPDDRALFHNADIYPPDYNRIRSVTWRETDRPSTLPLRLQVPRASYPLERYFLWAFTETPAGKWRREFLVEPLLYLSRPVHWRNYEAGYNAGELEPGSREKSTYVLQEYFVSPDRFNEFVPRLSEILKRHQVNMLNISIRHAQKDPGSLLAWAREEVFAFVLYYKQGTAPHDRAKVAVWTRELIEAALDAGGSYYLPYQPHATPEQFHRAYPQARHFFELKAKWDPQYRLRNILWDIYYAPPPVPAPAPGSDFQAIYLDTLWRDRFYRFLQNVFHLFPEDRFHALIERACAQLTQDEAIYRRIQKELPRIKPFLSEIAYAVPALQKQKKEMTRQALVLLERRRDFNGYLEIGSTGRYWSELRKHLRLNGPLFFVHESTPTNSPADILERGGLRKHGRFLPLNNYQPLPMDILDESLDLVTCYIGLHHSPPERLQSFIRSIVRVLRPGGLFILRDHDVKNLPMGALVSLAHAVFNAGLGISWEENQKELRLFAPLAEWSRRLEAEGLKDKGERLFQANDPTDNALMIFSKPSGPVDLNGGV